MPVSITPQRLSIETRPHRKTYETAACHLAQAVLLLRRRAYFQDAHWKFARQCTNLATGIQLLLAMVEPLELAIDAEAASGK